MIRISRSSNPIKCHFQDNSGVLLPSAMRPRSTRRGLIATPSQSDCVAIARFSPSIVLLIYKCAFGNNSYCADKNDDACCPTLLSSCENEKEGPKLQDHIYLLYESEDCNKHCANLIPEIFLEYYASNW